MRRKKWNKPKLIVLVRGKPEEGVLGGCKSGSTGGSANADQGKCDRQSVVGDCENCLSNSCSS